MSNKFSLIIDESGLKFKLYYTRNSINKCFIPDCKIISNDFRSFGGQRYIVAIAGPPGCGKSSIAHLLSYLLKREFQIETMVLPLDGFHYNNEYLKSVKYTNDGNALTLYDIKGAPETYDTKSYKKKLQRLVNGDDFYWPVYSRKTHNPIEKGIKISRINIIYIIEGNYLLLHEPPWKDLIHVYNKKIFIWPKEKFLKNRIIKRKLAGGYNRKESLNHYTTSDRENIRRVLNNSKKYDILIMQKRKYHYNPVNMIKS